MGDSLSGKSLSFTAIGLSPAFAGLKIGCALTWGLRLFAGLRLGH
jgi:hypothetical protein